MIGNKTNIIRNIDEFKTNIENDTDAIIICESLNVDNAEYKLSKSKVIYLEDGVIMRISSKFILGNNNITFRDTGESKILFSEGYSFDRIQGSIIMKVRYVEFDISLSQQPSFELKNNDIWESDVKCYFSGEIDKHIDMFNFEMKYPKPIFNINSINPMYNITLGKNSLNIHLCNKDTLGCIFYIRGNGNVNFGENITVTSDNKSKVNYGIYIDRSRYMNKEINIRNMDLGEDNVHYLKQYIVWLDILGECFKSERKKSYVAVSVTRDNLDNIRTTKNNIKCCEIRSIPINLCFGKTPDSDIKLKTKLRITHNNYFDIDDLNSLVENNNTYFGCFSVGSNFISDKKTEYVYSLSQTGLRIINSLFEFVPIEPVFVGDTECEISFDSIKSEEYVMPISLKYNMLEGDIQDMTVKCYNDETSSYSLTEYILDKNFYNEKQVQICMTYKSILPMKLNITSNSWDFPLRISHNDEYETISNFNYMFDKKEDKFMIKVVDDEFQITGAIYINFEIRNKNKDRISSFTNKIYIQDDNNDELKVSKDTVSWAKGSMTNRISFLEDIKGSVYFQKDLISSILYSDVEFYISNKNEANVRFNIHSCMSKFNIIVYDNREDRDTNFDKDDEYHKTLKLRGTTKIYARIFYNGDDVKATLSEYGHKIFYIDITDNDNDKYYCGTSGSYITETEVFIKHKDKWYRGRDLDNINTELNIILDTKEDIEFELYLPYVSDEKVSYDVVSKSHSKLPDIEIPIGHILNSNSTKITLNLTSKSVFGERIYNAVSSSHTFAPKINFIIKEINSRGIEIYIDNIKCLSVDASDNLYVSDYDVVKFNPPESLNSYPFSRNSYIECYIILKSKPIENCIFSISARCEKPFNCMRRKLSSSPSRYSSPTSSLDFIFTCDDYDQPSQHKFYIDISQLNSSSSKLTLALSSEYSFFNDQSKDIDYRTLQIKSYDFHVFKFYNIIDIHTETEYINLGFYIITTDDEGNLVIKKRNKTSSNQDDFITTKILETYE